jgi:hypothetical protein
MTQRMILHLERFGREALEGYARSSASSRSAAVVTAIRYYLAEGEAGRPAWRVPNLGSGPSGEAFELEIDEATYAQLEREAARQRVTLERLAEHALFYFLADLEAGRVAARLGDALERDANTG